MPAASLDDLLKTASSAMESLDTERAYQAYYQASSDLKRETLSTKTEKKVKVKLLIYVLEKMGECQVSIGNQDLARDCFSQSLRLLEEEAKLNSTRNTIYYETYSSLCFYIGQLSLGKEALEAYQKGIHSLEECILRVEEDNSVTDGQEPVAMQDDTEDVYNIDSSMRADDNDSVQFRSLLRQKLSGAYCNLAELYLTDLCEEETAETDCEYYLEKALQLKDDDGEPLVDALQNMASLRLSQKERQLEAVPLILRAYEKQRVGSEALATLVGLQLDKKKCDAGNDNKVGNVHAQELVEVEAANNLPEFEFRCQTAKLLLECAMLLKESSNSDQEDECVVAAISVLGSLLAQNDEVTEIWFLTGCVFAAKNPPLIDTAMFYLERAKEMLTDIRKALKEEAQFIEDSELPDLEDRLEMNTSQMSEVQSKIDELQDQIADGSNDNIMED